MTHQHNELLRCYNNKGKSVVTILEWGLDAEGKPVCRLTMTFKNSQKKIERSKKNKNVLRW